MSISNRDENAPDEDVGVRVIVHENDRAPRMSLDHDPPSRERSEIENTTEEQFKDKLFRGFRDDHAIMGQAFHDLAVGLRGGDYEKARGSAQRVDEEVGAHIAFEEHDVYPLLVPILGQDCVAEMYQDHREGRAVIERIAAAETVSDEERKRLLARTEEFQEHIEECASLFNAIAQLPEEFEHLHERRLEWLEKRPRWTELD